MTKYTNLFQHCVIKNNLALKQYIKNLDNKRRIKVINQLYSDRLIKTIHNLIYGYSLSMEAEDIYSEFLLKIPEILDDFDKKVTTDFEPFLFSYCKYFTFNMIKFLTRKKRNHNNLFVSNELLTDVKDENALIDIDNSIFNIDFHTFYKNLDNENQEDLLNILRNKNNLSNYKIKVLRKKFLTQYNNFFKSSSLVTN